MNIRGYKLYLGRFIYLVLFIIVLYLIGDYFNVYNRIDNSTLLLRLDNRELLLTIWQIQALVLSLSYVALTIMQSSFNIRIYGQRISRVESYRIFNRILSSLFLIGIMTIPVIYNLGVLAIAIFIISLCEVKYFFWRVVKLMRRPHTESIIIKKYVIGLSKRFVKKCKFKKNVCQEFEDVISYLISHTKELIRENNYIEVHENQELLNDIVEIVLKSKRYDCIICKRIFHEYNDLKNKYADAKWNDLAQEMKDIPKQYGVYIC